MTWRIPITMPWVIEVAKETPASGDCVTAGWGTKAANSSAEELGIHSEQG